MESSSIRAPLDAPIPGHWSVRQGRDAYLAENGFPLADYDAARTPASLLGMKFSVPNTPAHRRAIMQHDLHHVATGYGTDPTGEGEISAWEARAGMGPLNLYVRGLVLTGVMMGLLIAPWRTLRAWRVSSTARGLFAHGDEDYEALLSLSVDELRTKLGVPAEGLARRPRRLHSTAPK